MSQPAAGIDRFRTPRATCLLAPNPSPMTLDGTNTWLIAEPGSSSVVVVDPGPDDAGHLRRVHAAAVAGDRRRWPALSGPGSTTTTEEEPGSAISQVLVPSSVIGEGLGASTQVARGVRNPSMPAIGTSLKSGTPWPAAWSAMARRPRRSPRASAG